MVNASRLNSQSRIGLLFLALIIGLAAVLRLWNLDFGLPARTHVDEPAYVVSALRIASGELKIDYPLNSPNIHQLILAANYGVWFIAGRLLGIYNSPAEFAEVYLTDPSFFYLLGRLSSVIASVCTVGLIYLVGRKLLGSVGGLIAAALLATAFIDARHAHFVEPYALISLLIVGSLYAAILFLELKRYRYLYVCSFLAGAAIALRFSFFICLLIPATAFWIHLRSRPSAVRETQNMIKILTGSGLGALAGFCIAYPGIFLGFDSLLASLKLYGNFAQGQAGFEGFVVFHDVNGWVYYLRLFQLALGLPILLAVMAGVGLTFWQRKGEWFLVIIFPLVYFALIGFSQMAFVRYTVPLMPFFSLLAAFSIVQGQKAAARGLLPGVHAILLLFLLAILVYVPMRNTIQHNRLLGERDTRAEAKSWIEDNIPDGAIVAVQWYAPALATAEDPEPNSRRVYDVVELNPFANDPQLYTLDFYAANGVEYLVITSYIYQLQRVNKQEQEQRETFYDALDSDALLLATFSPISGRMEAPFNFEELYSPLVSLWERDRPGPTIKVYQLSN